MLVVSTELAHLIYFTNEEYPQTGARKHQFDAEQDCNKGLVLANYDNIHNTAKTEAIQTLQCPKCGHRIERNNLSCKFWSVFSFLLV